MTYIGVSPSNGVRRVHTYTASGSQTTFTGASSEGITLSYTDANFMDVYQNGVLLAPADYTATSGTSVVLAEGAAASDIVTITVYDAFSVADTVSKSAGGTFDGNVAMAGTLNLTSDVTFTGANANIVFDKSDDALEFADNVKAKFGTGNDLEIYHEGNHSFIVDNGTGDLYIRASDNLNIQSDNGSGGWQTSIQTQFTGATNKVALFHGGTQVFSTLSNGISIDVSGGIRFEGATADGNETFLQVADPTADRTITLPDASGTVLLNAGNQTLTGDLTFPDNEKAIFGTGGDLEIYHDTTNGNSVIHDTGSGNLRIRADDFQVTNAAASANLIFANDATGEVKLYHNGSEKIATTSSGVTVTGSILTTNIYGANDGNTGIQFEGSDVLTFHAGGQENIQLTSNSIVFNQDSIDMDFRIESNNKTNVFFVDAGNDRIGMGTDTPSSQFVIYDATSPYIYLQNSTTGQTNNNGFSIIEYGNDAYINNRQNGNMLFYNSNTERARLTSGGTLLVGKTSTANSAAAGDIQGAGAGAVNYEIRSDSAGIQFGVTSNHYLCLRTNNTERVRIHSNGNLALGTTDNQARLKIYGHLQSYNALMIQNGTNNTGGLFISFRKYDNVTIGSVSHSGSGSSVAFNTTSDYRLKENVSYDFDATSRLKQLKPARFNWIADKDNTLQDGFLAHEVSSIVPEAITGDKDAVDADGNIDPQGIDQSKLVPLLTKALQEQQATIEALTARITTLEGA